MKSNRLIRFISFVLLASMTTVAFSSNLENEKSIANIQSSDGNFSMRTSVYFQARVEYGDLIYGEDAQIESSSFDAYFRKASVGFYGNAFYPGLKYGVTLSGDETPQDKVYPSYSEKDGVALNGTYIGYKFSDALTLRFGKEKLPYSRIYLVSSTRQVFSERPYYMFSWEEVLRTYAHTHLSARGVFNESLLYSVSVGKAWRNEDEIYDQIEVTRSTPQLTARLQWSPRNWTEKKMSDTPFGTGRHFTIGGYYALQDKIEYIDISSNQQDESRALYGIDLSYHLNQLNVQAELNGWKRNSTNNLFDKEALGWVLQANYYLPSIKSEPALRYEEFDTDVDSDSSKVKKTTLGMNTYFKQQNLKLMLNLEHTQFEENVLLLKPDNKSTTDVFRVSLQFIL